MCFFVDKGEMRMGFLELVLIAVGLSMDAFAVSICKGLSVRRLQLRHMLLAGIYFGGFQALMPLLGYLLGSGFASFITAYDHWIAFVLLALIGGNMIREALRGEAEEEEQNADFGFRVMLPLAVATSIDALAVGISFAFLQVRILPAVLLIGATTFCFGVAGVKIGNLFGARYQARAELAGGVILILIGTKILLEHLGIFG